MKEYSNTLQKDLTFLRNLPISTEDKAVLAEAEAAFGKYDQGFPALLAEAHADHSPKTVARLMEGNIGAIRTARDRIQQFQKAAEADGEKVDQGRLAAGCRGQVLDRGPQPGVHAQRAPC